MHFLLLFRFLVLYQTEDQKHGRPRKEHKNTLKVPNKVYIYLSLVLRPAQLLSLTVNSVGSLLSQIFHSFDSAESLGTYLVPFIGLQGMLYPMAEYTEIISFLPQLHFYHL